MYFCYYIIRWVKYYPENVMTVALRLLVNPNLISQIISFENKFLRAFSGTHIEIFFFFFSFFPIVCLWHSHSLSKVWSLNSKHFPFKKLLNLHFFFLHLREYLNTHDLVVCLPQFFFIQHGFPLAETKMRKPFCLWWWCGMPNSIHYFRVWLIIYVSYYSIKRINR